MGEVRIRVDEIIGETEDVIRLCKEGGLELDRIVKTNKKIKVPTWTLYAFPILFILSLCLVIFINNSYVRLKIALSIIALALTFINVGLVYAKWEKQPLLWISIIAHIALVGLTYGVYTIEDVIRKAEDVVSSRTE